MDWFFGNGGDRKKGSKKPSKTEQRDNAKASSGREALNQRANDAADKAGLNADEKQKFHRHLTSLGDNNLSYGKLLSIAKGFKGS
jgi:hypothetical protein